METGYTARDVARLVDLPEAQVRALVRSGFLAPARDGKGGLRFTFQDVILLRTAKELLAAHISPTRVRRALAKLRRQLPEGRPLTGVAIGAEGNRIVVRDGGARWNPESGQVLFDFAVADLARDAAALGAVHGMEAARARRGNGHGDAGKGGEARGGDAGERAIADASAGHWYEHGCALEDDGDVAGAAAAYERALALDGDHVDAHVNLGRLMHDRGRPEEAVTHYQRALALRGDDAIAAFNLGVVLEDLGRLDEAARAYGVAIAADPRAADAHFNLAGLYERLGDRAAALRHLKAYKKLTGR